MALKSTFLTIGSSQHSDLDRIKNDFYATSPLAIVKLAEANKLPKNKNIHEPAAGQGHLSKKLIEYGYNVISTDLIDRGYGTGGIDFLKTKELLAPTILTNPPFEYCFEFAIHAVKNLKCEEYYAFHKITFLESKKRRKFFDEYPPQEVLVFSERMRVARNGEEKMFNESSATCYAWFIWRKGFKGSPSIGWL